METSDSTDTGGRHGMDQRDDSEGAFGIATEQDIETQMRYVRE